MTPKLNHSLIVSPAHVPQRRLLILHGAFGAGRNWGTIARRLVQARPEWGVVLADLRLHGASQGFLPPHTMEAAAADIDALAQTLGVSLDGVLGHSLGGKVALTHASRRPAGLRQVWVVDSTPAAEPPSGSAWQMLRAVRSLPAEFSSREEAVAGLVSFGFTRDVAQWMTANLERDGAHYRWRLDFAAVEDLLRDFFQTDAWTIVADPPDGVEMRFIKASDSDALSEETLRLLRMIAGRHRVHLHMVRGGHWIHADNPDAVVQLLAHHLP